MVFNRDQGTQGTVFLFICVSQSVIKVSVRFANSMVMYYFFLPKRFYPNSSWYTKMILITTKYSIIYVKLVFDQHIK